MTEKTPEELDRLWDDIPTGHAPIGDLLAAGHTATRRKRRALFAGIAAVTALILGGGFLLTQGILGLAGTNNAASSDSLHVRVEQGPPPPEVAHLFNGSNEGTAAAAWNPEDQTLIYVSGYAFSGTCPPDGTANLSDGDTLTLELNADSSNCTADARPVTVFVTGLTQAPPKLSVTIRGETSTVQVVGAGGSPDTTPDDATSSLSQDEIVKAETVARDVIAAQGASVGSASVIARPGTVKDSNTGHPCTSGRELQIKLIGDFPHTLTTGHPVKAGSPSPDFTVRAMIITADAQSGRACLIGVQTAENGEPKPLPGSTALSVG